MTPILRITLLLLTLQFTSLRAETEQEFIAKVTAAWQSNEPAKVLALYGKSLKEGSEFHKVKAAEIEMQMKTLRLIKAEIIPYSPVDEGPRIIPGKIVFMPKALHSLVMEMNNKDSKIEGFTKTIIPVINTSENNFSLGVPTVIPFEWNGQKMDGFDIKIETTGSALIPTAIVVFESCGYVSFIKMEGTLVSLGAHDIKHLIFSPLEGGGTATVTISKQNEAPFFQKVVDVSKGASISIEPVKP